jgi:hypothetical protein
MVAPQTSSAPAVAPRDPRSGRCPDEVPGERRLPIGQERRQDGSGGTAFGLLTSGSIDVVYEKADNWPCCEVRLNSLSGPKTSTLLPSNNLST